MSTLESLEAQVLNLTPEERSHLLDRLLASMEPDPEVEQAWDEELARRDAMAKELGEAIFLPGPETLAALRAEFSR